MSAQAFESVMARLYTDAEFRAAFERDAQHALGPYGLTETESQDLIAIDRVELAMAARSYASKVERRLRTGKPLRQR